MARTTQTVPNYCTLITRSRLMNQDQVKTAYRLWQETTGRADGDVESLRKFLVARKHLTEYQSHLLMRGHTEGYLLDEYTILEMISQGRMAGVFKARHASGQIVAIKVLPPSKAGDPTLLSQFQREGNLLTQLDHPNVLRTFQIGESGGKHYMVIEHIESEPLDEVLERRKRLPPPEAVRLICQVLQGLQHVFEKGMEHHDLRPSNLVLTPPPDHGPGENTLHCTVKILDLGLGRTSGSMFGTPDYLAPEQARSAHTADIRADIYSLGCILYHLLTGQVPFPDKNVLSQIVKHATESARPLSHFLPQAPEGLQQVLNSMMAKDPNLRYPTPERAALALQLFLPRQTDTAQTTTHVEAPRSAAASPPAAGDTPVGRNPSFTKSRDESPMSTWPTSQDYNEAIQNPSYAFADPDLKNGGVVLDALGLPVPCSGNFADVYQFKDSHGTLLALKCFTRKVARLQERYAAIGEHIAKTSLPFLVGFEFLAEGIRIRGQWYPLLKMEWVEGLTLGEFVRDNADRPNYLHALSQMWAKLCGRIRNANFAHADLQHGNVLLVPGTASNRLGMRLIDYDGMWVPALADRNSGEIGHPNFQHPLRLKDRFYNADVDRFPLLVIATALRATLLGGRSVWDRFDNGDNLLFKEADFRAPAKAQIFKTLWEMNDDVLRVLLAKMVFALNEPLRKTPWLDDILFEEDEPRLTDNEKKHAEAMLGIVRPIKVAESDAVSGNRDLVNFIDEIVACRLVERARLDELVHMAESDFNVDRIAQFLENQGWLTRFQINEIRQGRGKGLQFVGYRLLEELPSAPSGRRFRAFHPALSQAVTLTWIDPIWLTPSDDAQSYIRRARAASAVNHPNLVNILDADFAGEVPFIVEEYFDGASLRTLVQDMGALPMQLACDYVRQAARALQAAHIRGIYHAGLSPSQLLLVPVIRKRGGVRPAPGAVVRIAGLGLTPRWPPLDKSSPRVHDSDYLERLEFMAPELLDEPWLTVSSDEYSLGAILYFLLTGRAPIQMSSAADWRSQIQTEKPVSINRIRRDLTPHLAHLINDLLSREKTLRPACELLMERLTHALNASGFSRLRK